MGPAGRPNGGVLEEIRQAYQAGLAGTAVDRWQQLGAQMQSGDPVARQTLQDLRAQLAEQQHQASREVVAHLLDAVSSLVRSHAALCHCLDLARLADLAREAGHQLQQDLQEWHH